jgi:hypothetical protein
MYTGNSAGIVGLSPFHTAAESLVDRVDANRVRRGERSSSMRTTSGLSRRATLRGFAAAGAALAVLERQSGLAQDATPTEAARHPLVGAWRIVPDPPGPPLVLIVYHADGTLTYSAPSNSPALPDAPFAVTFDTPAYGVWEPTGPRTAALSAYAIETDEAGNFLGTLAFHGTLELDEDLGAYAFVGIVEPTDPNGTVLGTFPVSTHATRIRVDRARVVAGTRTAGTPAP